MRHLRVTACTTVLAMFVVASPAVRAQSSAARSKSASPAGQVFPVTMRLSPRMAFAPAVVRTTVRVTPHRDNRLLRLTLDSPDYYRSSDVQLDGAGAPSAHYFDWGSLPPGAYSVVATVFGADGPRGQTIETLDVRGLGSR